MPPKSINESIYALNIYSNPNWNHYSPQSGVFVLFNKYKRPFFIKNGKSYSFNVRKNINGVNRLYWGNYNFNYLNAPGNAKNLFAHYKKSKNLKKRRPVLNSLPVARVRLEKQAAARQKLYKKQQAERARLNKIRNNYFAGKNISKVKLQNLLNLVMMYQSANAGAYYHYNNNTKGYLNNNGKPPTRQQLLNNLNNFREYNFFN